MDLMEFFERQLHDIDRFKALRDKVWQQIQSDNEKLVASFGGKENLNTDARKLHDGRINSFNAEWSMDGGSRYEELTEQHNKKYKEITGQDLSNTKEAGKANQRAEQPDKTTKQKFGNQASQMTDKKQAEAKKDNDKERQELREKIARQQAAIKARKMEKKRGR